MLLRRLRDWATILTWFFDHFNAGSYPGKFPVFECRILMVGLALAAMLLLLGWLLRSGEEGG